MIGLWISLRALLLLAAANMSPIGAKRLLGERWNAPVDGGLRFLDGQPLLGPSKTYRGFAVAIVATALAAALMGSSPVLGAEVGGLAMVGDAAASFVKRRLKLPPSGRAAGLDQIPEALAPLILLREPLGLSWVQVALVTLAFSLFEVPLAWASFRLGLRDRPY